MDFCNIEADGFIGTTLVVKPKMKVKLKDIANLHIYQIVEI